MILTHNDLAVLTAIIADWEQEGFNYPFGANDDVIANLYSTIKSAAETGVEFTCD